MVGQLKQCMIQEVILLLFLFQPHDVNVLGFTDYINYTDNILDIVGSVSNDTSISQCCNYNL